VPEQIQQDVENLGLERHAFAGANQLAPLGIENLILIRKSHWTVLAACHLGKKSSSSDGKLKPTSESLGLCSAIFGSPRHDRVANQAQERAHDDHDRCATNRHA
jgi:hypothetical protein